MLNHDQALPATPKHRRVHRTLVPHEEIMLGETEIPEEVFLEFIQEIAPNYTMVRLPIRLSQESRSSLQATYNLFTNNCNNFSNEVASFLLVRSLLCYELPRHHA